VTAWASARNASTLRDLLSGQAVAWRVGDGSKPHLFMAGEERLDTFGALPVRGGRNAHDWLLGHARQLMAYTALVLGAYLAISALVRLA
jgi:hypothetical protein